MLPERIELPTYPLRMDCSKPLSYESFGSYRARTDDLTINSRALYQLR